MSFCTCREGPRRDGLCADTAVKTSRTASRTCVERLGNIPLSRVRIDPPPGLATEADVLEAERKHNKLCELVDGVLVEKGDGISRVAARASASIEILLDFVEPRNLGLVSGADGTVRLFPGLVRFPMSRLPPGTAFPDRKIPKEPDPVARSRPGRRGSERVEYAVPRWNGSEASTSSGVRLIWEFDPEPRTVHVYTPDGAVKMLDASQTLDGGDVLPGFSLDAQRAVRGAGPGRLIASNLQHVVPCFRIDQGIQACPSLALTAVPARSRSCRAAGASS